MWAEVVIRAENEIPDEYILEWFGAHGSDGAEIRRALEGTDFEHLVVEDSTLERVIHAETAGTIVFALIRVNKRELRLHVQDRVNKTSLEQLKFRVQERIRGFTAFLKRHGNKPNSIRVWIYAEGEYLTGGQMERWLTLLWKNIKEAENAVLEIFTPVLPIVVHLIKGKSIDSTLVVQSILIFLAFILVMAIKAWFSSQEVLMTC